MEYSDLVGKTILSAQRLKSEHYDDSGYIGLTFTDGTRYIIEGGHKGIYSSNALNEYPSCIAVRKVKDFDKLKVYQPEEDSE